MKGNKAGNRNTIESKQTAQKNQRKANNDKRIGSKKPIALVVEDKKPEAAKPKVVMQPKVQVVKTKVEPPKAKAPVKLSPEKELAELENNDRLNDLLEQEDAGETLSKDDQVWLDKQMARHQELMTTLGWIDDEGEEDLLQQFEDASSALDEYK